MCVVILHVFVWKEKQSQDKFNDQKIRKALEMIDYCLILPHKTVIISLNAPNQSWPV